MELPCYIQVQAFIIPLQLYMYRFVPWCLQDNRSEQVAKLSRLIGRRKSEREITSANSLVIHQRSVPGIKKYHMILTFFKFFPFNLIPAIISLFKLLNALASSLGTPVSPSARPCSVCCAAAYFAKPDIAAFPAGAICWLKRRIFMPAWMSESSSPLAM